MPKKPTIHELEELLNDPDTHVHVNPDGSVTTFDYMAEIERLTTLRDKVIGICESYEESAAEQLEAEAYTSEHEKGYLRGQQYTAKHIRRWVGEEFQDTMRDDT